ncbi:putative inactive dehydrogenase EasA [Favolaschia claudopus]|uniref:Inactive dehydrogenase EasA n=1 Tax=Favolaschia claudopus TaxID=2862362 RepID=A0AAV9ZLN5_9AGAR
MREGNQEELSSRVVTAVTKKRDRDVPIKVGKLTLKHRVVLPSMTRLRADANHVPYLPLVAGYFTHRARRPGKLPVTDAMIIAARAGGTAHTRLLHGDKCVTDTVHHKTSFIFSQQTGDPSFPYVSVSNVQLTDMDIKEYVALFAQSAKSAIEAGFDGVEIHAANRYLIHQFLHDEVNHRMDEYGGSVENRARFAFEILSGAERTAIRFSPWNQIQYMAMRDPIPTFSYVISQLAQCHPDLAYLHLVEPPIVGAFFCDENSAGAHVPCAAWASRRLVRAGGYTHQTALETAEESDNLIARILLLLLMMFIMLQPDLVTRIEKDIPYTPYDRLTFYLVGDSTPRGYPPY